VSGSPSGPRRHRRHPSRTGRSRGPYHRGIALEDGGAIAARRIVRGLTQEAFGIEVARAAGEVEPISERRVRIYERGEEWPSEKRLLAMAAVLKVSRGWLEARLHELMATQKNRAASDALYQPLSKA
jgi:transcriptional regulator with XRE-family HTH domain